MQHAPGARNVPDTAFSVNPTVPRRQPAVKQYSPMLPCPACDYYVPANAPRCPSCGNSELGELETADSITNRARALSAVLFQEARRWPEYRTVLATRWAHDTFKMRVCEAAYRINAGAPDPLSDGVVNSVAKRLAQRIASWEHSPERQRARQAKQAASRRRRTRGRDLQILRMHERGISNIAIATLFPPITEGAVRYILKRDS